MGSFESYGFSAITLYALQQTGILNPSLNSFDNFALSSVDKVTIAV